jgi:ribosome biogenesis GTPase
MRHSNTATVTASYGRRGVLQSDGQQLPYILKGRRLRPVCGDRVEWQASDNEGQALVTAILERRNVLQRPDARGKAETLAANLDCLAAVIAPQPAPDFFIVDRFICAAELMHADAVLVWNKCDLQTAETEDLEVYRQLGYPVLSVSAQTGAGIDELSNTLGRGISMLAGQSGVGKSSLINQLVDDADVLTGELSESSGEGRHTTTASIAHQLPAGGLLVDSPGIRDFAPLIRDVTLIQNGFREILLAAEACRFTNCQHTREPNCAVQAAVGEGHISPRRYESYKRLRNTSAQLSRHHR